MTTPNKIFLSSVASGFGGYRILPETPGDFAATLNNPYATPWVAGIADLNGDGIPDVIVGSPGSPDKAVGAGRVFVDMGSGTGGAPVTLGDTLTQIIADGVAANDLAGSTVGSIGDMNGDGKAELLIGAPFMNRGTLGDTGVGFVVWGLPGAGGIDLGDPASAAGSGFAIRGEAAGDKAGTAMAAIGSLNGDAKPDILVGAPGNDAGGTDAGAAYVVYGRSAISLVNLSSLGAGGYKITGAAAGDLAGSVLASIPDMNGDGLPEIVVGAPGSSLGGAGSGAAYVVFGKAGTTTVNLATLGAGGFRIIGANAGDAAGGALASVGDVNGDGKPDLLIGSPGGDHADIVFGQAGTTDVNLSSVAAGTGGYTIIPENSGDLVNLSVAGGADLNGDGIPDLVIGASHNSEGGFNAGAVYVVWGGAGGMVDLSLVAEGIGGTKIVGTAGSLTGASVAVTGDMNGDGVSDLIIGSPGAGESVSVVYADSSWQPDPNIYGTNGNDTIGLGYGGYHTVGDTNDTISSLAGNDSVSALGGNDSINGGLGDDTIDAGTGDDTLNGGGGDDVLIGGAGNDIYLVDQPGASITELPGGGGDTVIASIDWTLAANVEALTLTGGATSGTGNDGANTLTAGSGNATLDGAGGDDTLTGSSGNDSLIGGSGADSMAGGAGNDSYVVDNSGDIISELSGAGNDTVFASVDWTLGDNLEALTLTGTATNGTGNSLNNTLTGTTGNNSLDGGAGDDTLIGGGGDDTLAGGVGNDVYYVDSATDVVNEAVGGGDDTVYASVDWTMSANIESLVLTGTGPHNVTGNTANNDLVGSSGDDTLNGGGGDDTLVGGDGNDVLIAESGHSTLAGGSGNDRYVIHGGRAHIEDFLGHDTIDASQATGDSYIDLSGDTLSHVEGEDVEIGQGGSTALPLDVQFLQDLTGSFADDIITVRGLIPGIVTALQAVQSNTEFGVSTFRDKGISPFGNAGDWVYQMPMALSTSVATLETNYTNFVANNGNDGPEAQIEALMQLGLHMSDVGFRAGSAHFVVLFTDAPFHVAGDGAAGGIFTPNNGDGILNGSPPGTGEDYPIIAQVKAAIEAANIIPIFAIAGGYESTYQGLVTDLGRGTVITLTSNSSNVVGAITAGLSAATVTTIEDVVGGAGNDVLKGNGADNTRIGNAGNDTLDGGAGNDSYVVDTSADTIVELSGGGYDIVHASASFILPDNVERLDLTGTGDIAGTGNALNNTLYGNDGANLLSGGDGNDVIRGGSGNDTLVGGNGVDKLTGGAGQDTFRYLGISEGHDHILDFNPAADTLEFSALGFGGGLTDGMATNAIFVAGTKATAATGQFIYNQPKGTLFWDPDGTGPQAKIWLATLDTHPVLTSADLVIAH